MKIARNILIVVMIAFAGAIVWAMTTTGEITDSENKITIRFGHGAAETNERHLAVVKFKELAEERSNGKIEVLIYPNEVLGSEAEMIESVTLNDLQMVAAGAFSQYDPRIGVFELPYLFDSYEQAWEVLDGPIGGEVAEIFLKDNLRILAYFENGFRHVTSNKPVEKPEDLKGVKIRTPENPLSIRTFDAFGSNPTPMAFGELYTGLQQGTVDAQENPVANTYASRLYEVQDYVNLTGHQYMPLPVAISEEFWQTLPEDLQEIIFDCAREAAQYHRDLIKQNEEKILAEMEAAGATVVEADKEAFKALVDPVYDYFRSKYGDDLLDKVLDAIE